MNDQIPPIKLMIHISILSWLKALLHTLSNLTGGRGRGRLTQSITGQKQIK